MGGEPSSFHPLTRKKRSSLRRRTEEVAARRCQSNEPCQIDWESLLRAAKRDKDLRCSARAAIQAYRIDQAHRIDFSSGFPERFARQFAALSVAGGPVNSQ